MQGSCTSGRAATFAIPALDDAGQAIAATAAEWALYDDRGLPIAAGPVSSFVAGADAAAFRIEAEHLTLAADIPSAGREIVVSFETADGPVEARDFFVLVASRPLVVMVNSFMSYAEALSVRSSFGPTLDGWDVTSSLTMRQGALAEAFERIARMIFAISHLDPMTHASSYAAYGTGADEPFDTTRRLRLRSLTVEQFDALPDQFRRAVKRAQLMEANVLLGGDAVGKKRQDGVISETIGESSIFFSSKPYLNLPVSRQAFEELKRYVVLQFGVLRA
jgi:hypothetical protein